MITIISGTNRPDSNSAKVAEFYQSLVQEECQILHLKDLPNDFVFADTFTEGSNEFQAIVKKHVTDADKFVFIIPEYNGGFPGVLKAFIDAVPPKEFATKKSALVGISAGHTGALAPLNQFTEVLHYLKVEVMAAKPKLSGIDALFTGSDITDERALTQLKAQSEAFSKF